jgi:hypothetical protein
MRADNGGWCGPAALKHPLSPAVETTYWYRPTT